MKYLFLCASLTLVLSSCSGTEGELPIPEGDVVNLLTELHLADSRMLLDETSPDSLRSVILSRHGLDDQSFDDLTRFLSNNPDQMADIYGKVVDKIVATEDRVPEIQE